jgi:hypothetical protein
MSTHFTKLTTDSYFVMSDTTSDSDDDPAESHISIEDGLSLEALTALLHFQSSGFFEADKDSIIPKNTACATYTAKDSQVISETYRRLQAKEDVVTAALKAVAVLERTIVDLVPPVLLKDESLADVLLREGVVRVNHVMEAALCDRCLADLNAALAEKTATSAAALLDLETTTTTTTTTSSSAASSTSISAGFGDIYSSNCRNDMYLRNEGTAAEALKCMLHSGTELADLFQACLPVGRPGVFHEFAALMTDSGAASQPVHPDSH